MVATRSLRGKHLITFQEWTKEEINAVLENAFDLKKRFARNEPHELLKNKTLFMLFYNPSTRTRNSFEAGMTQLGGHAHFLSPETMWVRYEKIRETVKILSRYGHGIAVRYYSKELPFGGGNRVVRQYAKWAGVPVINMEDGMYHPCQGIADLMTIKEKFNDVIGKKFVLSWAYSSSIGYLGSECHTNLMLMPRFGLDVTVAYPEGFNVAPWIVETARKNAEETGASFNIVHNMKEAFEGAHIVYSVNFASWKHLSSENDPKEGEKRALEQAYKHRDWTCTQELMDVTAKNSIFMHCMPFVRGEEVTDEVADGPKSAIYDEAENRLHTQKAILALTIGGH